MAHGSTLEARKCSSGERSRATGQSTGKGLAGPGKRLGDWNGQARIIMHEGNNVTGALRHTGGRRGVSRLSRVGALVLALVCL